MEIVRTVSDLRSLLGKIEGGTGFVPTMGALHSGHISLVKKARDQNETVVVSIFVNPTQFNDPRDLERYPRCEEADIELLEAAGADIVFVPSVKEIYPQPDSRQFDFGPLERVMEGAHRPGHFNGVAQVVSRLFEIVGPRRAYFGEKDFQQIAVIEAMVQKLGFDDIEIVRCPIIRDADGLALSSRNVLLDTPQRESAPRIYKTLKTAAARIADGEDTDKIKEWARREIDSDPQLETEYIEIVDPVTLQSVGELIKGIRIFAAVRCGKIRLIDNMAI